MTDKDKREKPLILTVDDDPLMRMAIAKMVEDVADVMCATNTYDAEEQMRLHHPDLVLLDDIMPNCPTGLSFLETLKEDDELAHIPVVMVTASDKESEVERGMAAGAVAYITKPVDMALLKKTIVRTLSYKPKKIGICVLDEDKASALVESFLYLQCEVVIANTFSDAESWADVPDLVVLDDWGACCILCAREGWGCVSFVLLDAAPDDLDCLKGGAGKRISFISPPFVLHDIVREAGHLLREVRTGAS